MGQFFQFWKLANLAIPSSNASDFFPETCVASKSTIILTAGHSRSPATFTMAKLGLHSRWCPSCWSYPMWNWVLTHLSTTASGMRPKFLLIWFFFVWWKENMSFCQSFDLPGTITLHASLVVSTGSTIEGSSYDHIVWTKAAAVWNCSRVWGKEPPDSPDSGLDIYCPTSRPSPSTGFQAICRLHPWSWQVESWMLQWSTPCDKKPPDWKNSKTLRLWIEDQVFIQTLECQWWINTKNWIQTLRLCACHLEAQGNPWWSVPALWRRQRHGALPKMARSTTSCWHPASPQECSKVLGRWKSHPVRRSCSHWSARWLLLIRISQQINHKSPLMVVKTQCIWIHHIKCFTNHCAFGWSPWNTQRTSGYPQSLPPESSAKLSSGISQTCAFETAKPWVKLKKTWKSKQSLLQDWSRLLLIHHKTIKKWQKLGKISKPIIRIIWSSYPKCWFLNIQTFQFDHYKTITPSSASDPCRNPPKGSRTCSSVARVLHASENRRAPNIGDTGGFLSHGVPPIAGWFSSWEILLKYGYRFGFLKWGYP